jgi:hypothetical protein
MLLRRFAENHQDYTGEGQERPQLPSTIVAELQNLEEVLGQSEIPCKKLVSNQSNLTTTPNFGPIWFLVGLLYQAFNMVNWPFHLLINTVDNFITFIFD